MYIDLFKLGIQLEEIKTIRQKVIEFMKDKSLVRPKDLVEEGLPRDYLYQMMQDGDVIKVDRGLYRLVDNDINITQWHSFVEVQKRVPKGVICLLSALVFHRFTTQNPHQIWLSIDHKARQSKFDYPPVRFIRMSGASMNEFIENHRYEGAVLRIYSAAKTVADCFKFRNQVGLDVAIEALKEGWQSRKFSMDELMSCARVCRVSKVIQPYAETIVYS